MLQSHRTGALIPECLQFISQQASSSILKNKGPEPRWQHRVQAMPSRASAKIYDWSDKTFLMTFVQVLDFCVITLQLLV